MAVQDSTTIVLFDVDGTLTVPRQVIKNETEQVVQALRKKVLIGLVGGSDLVKIAEQLETGTNVHKRFDYVFSENGLVAHKNGVEIGRTDMSAFMGEEVKQRFINFALRKMSELTLPCKRGNFVEHRTGMLNICPVGRSCTQAERDEFAAFDQKHNVRGNLVAAFKKEFPDAGLTFSIGGQISIDVYPDGWDKRFCIQYLEKDNIKNIFFFGDKTMAGGNDHEIFSDKRTQGFTVTSPEDTCKQITEKFLQ